jgi:hypothetical protein
MNALLALLQSLNVRFALHQAKSLQPSLRRYYFHDNETPSFKTSPNNQYR